MSKQKWKRITDEQVRHIWVLADDCADCEIYDDDRESAIPPEWYADNGTPICPDCGTDMVYSHTEIREEL